MAILKVLQLVGLVNVLITIVNGQSAHLSMGGNNISNNSEVVISTLGEDAGLATLTCHTDLTECCRTSDTGTMGMGEWYYPSGEPIPNQAAGEDFYRVRNAPQVVRLARRRSTDAFAPVGSYCCVVPTTGGEMTVCATIVVCPSFSLSNGVIVYSDPMLGGGTVATLECDRGYVAIGTGTRTCLNTGTWSNPGSSCAESCFDVPPPTNGDVSYNDGSVDARPVTTRATYSCDGSIRTCLLEREWSGSPPECAFPICEDLPEPPNGDIAYSDGTYNNRSLDATAVYSCALGYTLIGGEVRSCQSDKTWSGGASSCVETTCTDELTVPTNGELVYNSGLANNRPINSTATYSCDIGYTLNGASNRICEITGSWSGSVPACAETICSDLITPSNGSISYSSGTADSRPISAVVTYSCDIGYTLNGDSNRTCEIIGSWSGLSPVCVVTTCSDLATPTNGGVSYSSGPSDNRPISSIVTYSCDIGYTLTGTSSRTCEITGSWSGTVPACTETVCSDLITPSNGSISYSSGTADSRPISAVVTYSCDIGYTLNGDSNRTCEITGSWSSLSPVCVVTTCSDLTTPTNGSVFYSSGPSDNRPISSIATYSCDIGYTLTGTSSRTCEITGSWSGTVPACTETVCSDLITPSNGSISYSSGTAGSRPTSAVVTYSCDIGYTLDGDSNRTCEITGTWSGLSPVCVVTTCSDLATPTNGGVSYSSGPSDNRPISSIAAYSCDIGYTLIGTSSRTCEITGSWSGSVPACAGVSCGPLDSPNNGLVRVASFTFSNIATYECNYGYFLVGSKNRTCTASGRWSMSEPTCEPDYGALLTQKISAENYASVATLASSFASNSLNNSELQTSDGLMLLSRVFDGVSDLVDGSNITVKPEVVGGMVSTLNSLVQWMPGVIVAESSSSIVQSHETVVSVLAQQRNYSVSFSEVSLVAEMSETSGFKEMGGKADFTSANDVAASISLPSELFQQVPSDQPTVGVFYALYESPSLFPVTDKDTEVNSTKKTIVASPVIAATVGRNMDFTNIYPPVVIELELQDLPEDENATFTEGLVRCASWDFDSNSWVTDGCETERNGSFVQCRCTHLTNFAVLIDICSRAQDCKTDALAERVLSVISYVGVVVSCVGLLITVITLLGFKELRERDNTTHNVQLCIAIFCVLVVFAAGIERTEPYAGCVVVSVLIHYFSLVAVMWMGAEAVLMFQKLVIVFGEITKKYLLIISLICWSVPLVPVLPSVVVDITNGNDPETDLIVTRVFQNNSIEHPTGFCFLKHPGVFFGAFLAPIIALLFFNFIIFIWVIVVVLKSTKGKLERANEKLKPKTAIRVMISLIGVMFLFGLTWLFAAFTFTIAGNDVVRIIFQALFVVCAAFQGFFFFIFFCVLDKKARDAWKFLIFPSHKKYSVSNSNGFYRTNSRRDNTQKLSYCSQYVQKVSSSSLSQDPHTSLKTPEFVELQEKLSLKNEEC